MVKMDWVHDEVERLLKAGIIRHSVSPWCSPVIVIDKKQIPGQQKEFRLVVDYRALNSGHEATTLSVAIDQSNTHFLENEHLY